MSFLIDSDICSAFLRGDRRVLSRFMQYGGGIHLSSVTLAEIYTWVYRSPRPAERLTGMTSLLADAIVDDVDHAIAKEFGQIRADMLVKGLVVATPDLLIATTAISLNLTLVTHNTKHFLMVPGLRLQDWLVP